MLLELKSRDRNAPGIVQVIDGFPPESNINTERISEERAGPTDPKPETVMRLLTALFLMSSSLDLSDVEDSGGCS